MEFYILYCGLAFLIVFVIYAFFARERIALIKKIIVCVMVIAATMLYYFGAVDIVGRASPFGNGFYEVGYVHIDSAQGKIYIFTTGDQNDTRSEPRLFVIPMEIKKDSASTDIKDMDKITDILEVMKKKKILVKLTPKRHFYESFYGNEYKDSERNKFYVDDPLKNILPPKKSPK